jgi:hypothetical protein
MKAETTTSLGPAVTVDPEFKALIPAPTSEERMQELASARLETLLATPALVAQA